MRRGYVEGQVNLATGQLAADLPSEGPQQPPRAAPTLAKPAASEKKVTTWHFEQEPWPGDEYDEIAVSWRGNFGDQVLFHLVRDGQSNLYYIREYGDVFVVRSMDDVDRLPLGAHFDDLISARFLGEDFLAAWRRYLQRHIQEENLQPVFPVGYLNSWRVRPTLADETVNMLVSLFAEVTSARPWSIEWYIGFIDFLAQVVDGFEALSHELIVWRKYEAAVGVRFLWEGKAETDLPTLIDMAELIITTSPLEQGPYYTAERQFDTFYEWLECQFGQELDDGILNMLRACSQGNFQLKEMAAWAFEGELGIPSDVIERVMSRA